MLRKITFGALFSLLCTVFLTACLKDGEVPTKIADLNITTGIPVVYSKMSVADALDLTDTTFHVEVNSEGYYTFIFEPGRQAFAKAEDFMVLNNIELDKTNSLPSFPIVGAGSGISNVSQGPFTVSFSGMGNDQFKDADLRKIFFKNAELDIKMSSTYTGSVTVTLQINSLLKKTATAYISSDPITFDLSANSGTFTGVTKRVPLADHVLDMNPNGNQLSFTITINNISPGSSGEVKFEQFGIYGTNNIGQPRWSRIEGKMGTIEFPIVGNVQQDLSFNNVYLSPFNNNDNTGQDAADISFNFVKPAMFGKVYSTYGVPAQIKLSTLSGIGRDGSVVSNVTGISPIVLTKYTLGSQISPSGFTIPGSTLTQPPNSLFEKGPKAIRYSIAMAFNAASTSLSDFILDTSRIYSDPRIELPLYGNFTLFNLRDTTSNPLYEKDDATTSASTEFATFSAKKAMVKIVYENAIPFGFDLQVYFLRSPNDTIRDSSGKPLTLFNTGSEIKMAPASVEISGSNVGFSNKVESNRANPTTTFIDANVFEIIKQEAKYLGFYARVNSFGAGKTIPFASRPNVKVRPQDKITIQLSAVAEGKVKFNNK